MKTLYKTKTCFASHLDPVHTYIFIMQWIQSELSFEHCRLPSSSSSADKRQLHSSKHQRHQNRSEVVTFPLIHFDCALAPAAAGAEVEPSVQALLEPCEGELGCVLWDDAVLLFLPWLVSDIATSLSSTLAVHGTALCLGEGTGAVGCGLAHTNAFSQIIISDLPTLLPLLERNSIINNELCGSHSKLVPRGIDWSEPSAYEDIKAACSVIIGCEVLYGNRSVWPHLWECIRSSCAPENSLLYLCVTLRNARLDVDDFTSQYLMPNFSSVTECALSPLVVAVRAERLKL